MTPPIFKLCQQHQDTIDLLGNGDDMRLWAFGEAPDQPKLPYATWQFISGIPENHLDEPALDDHVTIQVDVYATQQRQSINTANALRRAIERDCTITHIETHGREPKTRLYRTGFDCDWWLDRQNY